MTLKGSKKLLAVLDRGQANFRRPGGFEAKTSKTVLEAKDVLEAATSGLCPLVIRQVYNRWQRRCTHLVDHRANNQKVAKP